MPMKTLYYRLRSWLWEWRFRRSLRRLQRESLRDLHDRAYREFQRWREMK